MGRKPKPAAVRRLEGTNKRPFIEGVVLPPCEPVPPWPLNAAAQKEWDRLCAALVPAGIVAQLDADALAVWAEAIATYRKCTHELEKHGILIVGVNGVWKANPMQQILKQALATMQKMQVEFGASPSSRMRVKSNAVPARDPFDAFLAEKTAR